jgi:hypothetical protein
MPVCLLLCMQVSVRVTFDRGDVEHFISEAIHLNDVGTTKYQTIVAGESSCDCGVLVWSMQWSTLCAASTECQVQCA